MQEEEMLYDDIELSEVQDDITIEEVAQVIEVTDVTSFDIEVSEAFPASEAVDVRNHALLYNREIGDAHPITAITGLREELNSIEALQTVYSDKKGNADYYEWADGNYGADNRTGVFVTLANDARTISICTGDNIFGVIVDGAAFVGGQDDIARDVHYGLVATSGVVHVRCELDVAEGDYVVSNSYGVATKANSNCGYKVVALHNIDGAPHAAIQLNISVNQMDWVGGRLQEVADLADANYKNIVSATNLANQAYKKAAETEISNKEMSGKVDNALGVVEKLEEDVVDMGTQVSNSAFLSAQARAIAESAATSASTVESRANDAWAKADNVAEEMYSLCAKIDKYSVGAFSQAYGLTLEQARGILETGMIYVPTESHKESYSYGETEVYERQFTPGYLYQWGYIPSSDLYGWITVDKNYSEIAYNEADTTNTSSMAVYFTTEEPIVSGNFGYWYTDGDSITGTTGTYEPYTLYKWERDHWLAVATVKGNVSNRMASEIYQTTNEISAEVMNARGSIATLGARLTDTEAIVQNTAKWAKGTDEEGNKIYNIATIRQTADEDGSNLALVVTDTEGNKVLNGASIVLSQEDGTSSIYLDASKITLNGEASFTTTDAESGETKIDGGNIYAKTLSAISTDLGTVNTGCINIMSDIVKWEASSQGLTYELSSDETYYIVKNIGSCKDKNLIIPSTYNDLPVASIKDSAFSGNGNILKVVIPSSINDIGSRAFNSCAKLTHVEIGDGVTSIGDNAFAFCSVLASVKIPDSVTSIGVQAFYYCRNLINIDVPDGVTSIGEGAFRNCSSLMSVKLGNQITNIDNNMFYDCKSLSHIVIPDNVTSIGSYVFNNCTNLQSIVIGANITSIGSSAFNGCTIFKCVYYKGTEEEREYIEISNSSNTSLTNATWYYYTETDELGTGWRYNDKILKSNADNSYIIDSEHFKVLRDGSVVATQGVIGGCSMSDGILYVSSANISGKLGASNLSVNSLSAITSNVGTLTAGVIRSSNYSDTKGMKIDLDSGTLECVSSNGNVYLYSDDQGTGSSVGNSGSLNTWRIKSGSKFGVTKDGTMHASAVNITGGSFSLTTSTGDKITMGSGFEEIGIASKDFSTTNRAGRKLLISASDIAFVSGEATQSTIPITFTYSTADSKYKHYLTGNWFIGSVGSSTPVTSDRNSKNSIELQGEEYSRIFDRLKPVIFKYNDGSSDRIHTGFIAQDVEDAILAEGMTTQQFAAVCYETDEDGNKVNYGVRYEEIVSMNTHEIQKLKARTAKLEARVAELESKLMGN